VNRTLADEIHSIAQTTRFYNIKKKFQAQKLKALIYPILSTFLSFRLLQLMCELMSVYVNESLHSICLSYKAAVSLQNRLNLSIHMYWFY